MGSAPWKQAQMDRWEEEFVGKLVRVTNPGAVYRRDDTRGGTGPIVGKFMGQGTARWRPCIYVHVRPDLTVREPDYFDHEVAIMVERGMTVEAAGEMP